MKRKYILLIVLIIITFGHIVKKSECKHKRPKGQKEKHDMEGHWHVVSIRLRPLDNPFGHGHICSGTLFSDTKILTSADCLIQDMKMVRYFNPSQLRVVLGITNRYHKLENTVVISSGVKYACHPDFDIETGENDVSVIFIQQGILKNHPFIKPLPLISSLPVEGTNCMVSSWAYTENAIETSSHIEDTNMKILNGSKCSKSREKKNELICVYNVQANMNHTHDGCWSEIGEGLVCDLQLAGIVAYDISCQWHDDKGRQISKHTYFTSVSYHSKWIQTAEPMKYNREVILSNNQFLYLFGIILRLF